MSRPITLVAAGLLGIVGENVSTSDWGVGIYDADYYITCSAFASVDSRNFFAQIGASYARRPGLFAPNPGLYLWFSNGISNQISRRPDIHCRMEPITITIAGQGRTFWAERSDLDLGRWIFTESFIDFVSSAPDTATMQVATPDGETFSFSLDGAT